MKPPVQPPTEQPREMPPAAPVSPNHEQIADRARVLWEERGRPEGRDLEHWLEAERELTGGSGGGAERREGEANAGDLTDEDIESDKSVDGLVQRPREE